jgi:sugar lactone lactonase YvrE
VILFNQSWRPAPLRRLVPVTLAGALVANLAWGAGLASAQGAVPVPAGCAPIATALTAPRFVAVTDDNTVYVSEAGSGGTEVLTPPPDGGPGGPGGPPPTRGLTGQVTRIAAGGARSVVASGLPSYAMGPAEVAGPSGIVYAAGAIWLATGGPGPGAAVIPPLANENAVLRINPQTGAVASVADIGAIEKARNPDGLGIDSNLYGLALATDGNLYVADAGGNALYRVNPAGGQAALVTVFPGIALPPGAPAPPGGNPARGGRAELDPVPTGVAPNPAGGVYVGHLSGGPFPQGAAKVLRVSPGGQIGEAGGGLTAVVGVAVGPDRQLYVSEIFSQFDLSTQPPTPRPGRVRRVLPDGTSQVVLEGLATPNGIAFDRAGNLFVAVNTAFTPPGAQGQLLRCERIASPAPGFPRTGAGPRPTPGGGLSGSVLGLGALAGALALGGTAFWRRRAVTPPQPPRSSR